MMNQMIDLINSADKMNNTKLNDAKNLIFITLKYSSTFPVSRKSIQLIPTNEKLLSMKKTIANHRYCGYINPEISKTPEI